MAESISNRLNVIASNKDSRELKALLLAVLADNTRLATALDTLAVKLNADTGVTDEDYAANNAASIELEE